MSQIDSVFKDNFVISNMHFSQFFVLLETNHILWLLYPPQSELKCHLAPLAVNLEGFNLSHLGDRMAVKDKATECSPLPLTSVISIYFMLRLNSATFSSNEIIGIPFIGVERRWGSKSPFGGAGNIVTQFLRPRRPFEPSLHSRFSDSHMISGKRGIAGACSFLRVPAWLALCVEVTSLCPQSLSLLSCPDLDD